MEGPRGSRAATFRHSTFDIDIDIDIDHKARLGERRDNDRWMRRWGEIVGQVSEDIKRSLIKSWPAVCETCAGRPYGTIGSNVHWTFRKARSGMSPLSIGPFWMIADISGSFHVKTESLRTGVGGISLDCSLPRNACKFNWGKRGGGPVQRPILHISKQHTTHRPHHFSCSFPLDYSFQARCLHFTSFIYFSLS